MIRVLIVDDEPLVRIGIKSSIDWDANGFRLVGEASNGEQALEAAAETNPDIVITDIKMPVMDGIELIKRLQEKHPNTLPVVLSCYDDFEYVREAMKFGAADYYIKTDLNPDAILQILLGLKGKIDENREKTLRESKDRQLLGEYHSILRNNLMKALIGDQDPNEREIVEKLEMYGLYGFADRYSLMVMEIDNFSEVRKKYFEKDEKLLQLSIKNLLEEMYGKIPGFHVFVIEPREYVVLWPLYPDNPDGKPELHKLQAASRMIGIIKDYMNISVSVGISASCKGVCEVKKAYRECRHALEYKFFKGKGSAIKHSDVRLIKMLDKIEVLDMGILNKLKLGVKALDTGAVCEAAEIVKDRILKNREPLNPKAVKKTYIKLLEAFHACLREENLNVENESDPYPRVFESEDIYEVQSCIESYFKECLEKVICLSEEKGRSCIREILDYINSHYDRDISLQWMADRFGLNPSYFSRFFKKETGESFIGYLTKVRIEKSRVLLAKGVKAAEVAEKVGYPNYTYFSKLFKKVAGVSPSEYAEEGQGH